MDHIFSIVIADVGAAKRTIRFDENRTDPYGLSSYERLALWAWSLSHHAFADINRRLREGAVLSPDEVTLVETVDSALLKLPAARKLVYRGLNVYGPGDEILSYFSAGATYRWQAFTSATLDAEQAFGGNTLMFINSRNARQISLYSANFEEYEVVFPRGSQLRSRGAMARDGRYIVLLEEVV